MELNSGVKKNSPLTSPTSPKQDPMSVDKFEESMKKIMSREIGQFKHIGAFLLKKNNFISVINEEGQTV